MVVAQARDPGAHGAVAQDRGLQGVRGAFAVGHRIRTARAPAEGGHDVADGLDAGQRERRSVAFVGGRGEHPGAARLAERDGVRLFADAVDIKAGTMTITPPGGLFEELPED